MKSIIKCASLASRIGFIGDFRFAVTVLSILGCVLPGPLIAQDALSVQVGESELTPSVRVDYVTVDNAFNTSSNLVETTGFLISPGLEWKADRRLLELTASYKGEYASFSESDVNYTDHKLALRADARPGSKHRVFGSFSIDNQHEAIGTGQTAFVSGVTEQIVSTGVELQGEYAYGSANAQGNVGGGLVIATETFNSVGNLTTGDDNTEVRPYAFFTYRLSPDTRLRTQVNLGILDFDEDRRDRTELTFLVGLDLAASARTGGTVRIGVNQANYDTGQIDDTNTLVSDINLYFKPRSFSRFDLTFNRSLRTVDNEPNGAGESIVSIARLGWRHEWSSRFSTLASWRLNRTQRECPNNDTATNTAGIEFDVSVRRWLSVGAGVASVRRKAALCDPTLTIDAFDYDRLTFGVHLKATL